MGRKINYKFNPETLSYHKIEHTIKHKLAIALKYLATGLVFAVIITIIGWTFINSPKEKMLKREISELKMQYSILNDRLDEITNVLEVVQDRDDNIYRIIFEADPIPTNIRKSGLGGENRYAKFQGFNNSELIVNTTKKLDQLSKQIYIQSKSYDTILLLAKNKQNMLASIPAIQPISNGKLKRIASGFGWRIHPIYKKRMFHTGLDFTAPIGTKIYSTGNGVVRLTQNSKRGYGNHVIVDHGYRYKTLYAHMSKITVNPGQKIHRGDVIGYVGNSGTSTGPHLHYEVWKNNVKINPINFFFEDLTPAEYEQVIELSSKANQTFD